MLYISTRGGDTYTAARTLTANTAPDGGLFVPFQMPKLSVSDLKKLPQAERIAHILNLFFRTRLTGTDVQKCLGAEKMTLHPIDRKVTVVEGWTKLFREFSKIEYALYYRLCQDVPPCGKATQWPKIAIAVAVLSAVICDSAEGGEVDIAVNAGDFLTPMAVYYCRQMGMPVGTILCAVNENSGLWEFFTHGQLNCGASLLSTEFPMLDIAVPANLERLIFDVAGQTGAAAFIDAASGGSLYKVNKELLSALSAGFAVSVVSAKRVGSLIHRIYATNNYVLDSYGALTFGALQDYRASCGDIRQTLLLSAYSPIIHRTAVSHALNIPEFKLSEVL